MSIKKLVNRQHYSTTTPTTTTTTTEATTTHSTNHVKTYQAYSGSLQTPKNSRPAAAVQQQPAATAAQPGPYYYKPLVQPVYQPAAVSQQVEHNHLPPPPRCPTAAARCH